MGADEVRRIELGRGPRRWWPLVLAGAAAWVGIAWAVDGGDEEADPAPPSTPTTTTVSTTATTAVPGAPLLGEPTGWTLVVTGSSPRRVDVDTGAVTPFDPGFVAAARPDGLVVTGGDRFVWRPFPFDEGTAVPIGRSGGTVHLAPGGPLAWIVAREDFPATATRAQLVSLVDGALVAALTLPAGAQAVGVTRSSGALVVAAAGDTLVLGTDGSRLRFDGAPEAVVGDTVLVRSCAAGPGCGFVGVDVATGASRPLPALDEARWRFAGRTLDGDHLLAVVEQEPDGLVQRAVLVTPDGLRPALPPELGVRDRLRDGSWTPDGRLLVVPFANEVHVVDPAADGGPASVATFTLDPPPDGQLYVLATH